MSNATHTPGAMRAATAIVNGHEKVLTSYGRKSVEGLADLIERETGLPDLLAECEHVLDLLQYDRLSGRFTPRAYVSNMQVRRIVAAIAKATTPASAG